MSLLQIWTKVLDSKPCCVQPLVLMSVRVCLTGFLVRPSKNHGCYLDYVSQSDPCGKLPSVLVNKLTQKVARKVPKTCFLFFVDMHPCSRCGCYGCPFYSPLFTYCVLIAICCKIFEFDAFVENHSCFIAGE